jgi:hypothetical protein
MNTTKVSPEVAEKAKSLFASKYDILRPLLAQYTWDKINDIIIELCIDDVENTLTALDDDNETFYLDVLECLKAQR